MEKRKRNWILLVSLIALISIGVNFYLMTRQSADGTSAKQTELYVCPMHPQVQQDHPGDCPICGMKLVKQSSGMTADNEADNLKIGIQLSPLQEVLANVRTEKPRRESFMAMKSLPGRIVAKEDAQWKVGTRAMGRIEHLYISTPGESIRKGYPLYRLFSPDLANAQREYVLATQSRDTTNRTLLKDAARGKLLSLGFEKEYIAELEASGVVQETVTFHAQQNGVLMEKMASEGEWAMAGMTLLDFTDLSEVWVEGTIYEQDMASVHLGDQVNIQASGDTAMQTFAKVSFISPMVDMMTRTLTVRATLDNPEMNWKPEMFVEVNWMAQETEEVLTVPEDAVLTTGNSSRVWVKVVEGQYQPREVQVGARQDGRVAIVHGLQEDDEVVVSGGYLIDSDSQIKNMGTGHVHSGEMEGMPDMDMSKPSQDSQNGMNVISNSSTDVAELYVCPMESDSFETDQPGTCPKCGMKLVKKSS